MKWYCRRIVGSNGSASEGTRIVAVETPQGPLFADRFSVAVGMEAPGFWKRSVGVPASDRFAARLLCCAATVRRFVRSFFVANAISCRGSTAAFSPARRRKTLASTNATTPCGIADLIEFSQNADPRVGVCSAGVGCWAGLRPGNADGLPYLGAVPGCDNLFVAAGHFRAGIQTSPATGLLMADFVTGTESKQQQDLLGAFRLDRR